MPRTVISASRRTDIPAFYMPWFMEGIHRGCFEVVNPFNQKTFVVPVSPEQVHTIVFWSKNFEPFLSQGHGETLSGLGYRLFFNFTVNSSHPILEPMMPPLEARLIQMKTLAGRFGPQSIQWRFDPICYFESSDSVVGNNLKDFITIARSAADAGVNFCITSFADLYRKVIRRMKNHSNLRLVDPPVEQKVRTIEDLHHQLAPLDISLRLCCEKEVLAALPKDLPVTASACIPNDRLSKLYGPDISMARDQGQRRKAGCTCYASRDIGSYDLHPCRHNCLFCYANPAMDQ